MNVEIKMVINETNEILTKISLTPEWSKLLF